MVVDIGVLLTCMPLRENRSASMRKIISDICESAVCAVDKLKDDSVGGVGTRGSHRLSAEAKKSICSIAAMRHMAQSPTIAAISSVKLVHSLLDEAFAGGRHLAYIDGAFRRFISTHWIAMSEPELGGVILHHLPAEGSQGSQRTRAIIREVIDLLKMHQATGTDRSRLSEPLPIINVANGELWIRADGSVERRPHDPASGLRYCLDVVYDPNATCPHYDCALTEIFSVSATPAALVAFWNEFCGYTLQPSRPDARIFVGWGAGNDGKSALTGLLVSLLSGDRVAAMPVGKLASNRFMLGHLADKAMLLDDDVAVGTILADGLLKTVSEAKVVTGEPKNRDAFEFQVRAVPVLLCNAVPHLRDTSNGFRRRLIVIPFDRSFKADEADRTLFSRIKATELSGVLNRALEGLQRVARRGWRFDPSETVVQATDAWWAAATRLAPVGSDTAQRRKGAIQGCRPIPQATGAASRKVGTGKSTATGRPSASTALITVTVAPTNPVEGCAVKVTTSSATVEVRVEGESPRG